MNTTDVLALYQAELARCIAGVSAEAATIEALVLEVEREAAACSPQAMETITLFEPGRVEGRRVTIPKTDYFENKMGALSKRAMDNGSKPPAFYAWQAVRTKVCEALQLETPPPEREPEEDDEDLSERQKSHFKKLWRKADKLVLEAGITEGGRS